MKNIFVKIVKNKIAATLIILTIQQTSYLVVVNRRQLGLALTSARVQFSFTVTCGGKS